MITFVRTGPAASTVIFQRNEQIAVSISRKRSIGSAPSSGKSELVEIENTGIVKTPLNDIDRLNHRCLGRLAAGLGICLFAIVYQDRSLRVEKLQFAVKHRDRRLPIRSDGYHKFGSSYRAVRCRSFDLELTRFFAAKKISGTLFDIQRRFAAWCLRRFDFLLRSFLLSGGGQTNQSLV